MAPENILDKIQKLLDLKEGAIQIGSLEEAANAAEKARKLLLKYNLDMADVSLHTRKDQMTIDKHHFGDTSPKKNEGEWILSLYHTLSKYNLCKVVINTYHGRDYHGNRTQPMKTVVIIGTKTNVEVVRVLALRMEERIRTFERIAWAKDRHKHKNRKAYRRAYFLGAVSGIGGQLYNAQIREKRENSMVTSLVVQNDKDLNEAIKNLFGDLGKAPKKKPLSNIEGYYKGMQDGRQMPTGESLKS